MMDYATLKQNKGTVENLTNKFKEYRKKFDPNNTTDPAIVVQEFMSKLDPHLMPMVFVQQPATLLEAIRLARQAEAGFAIANPYQINSIEAQTEVIVNAVQAVLQANNQNKPVNQPLQRSKIPESQEWESRQKCYNCDKVGHIAKNCRAPKEREDNMETHNINLSINLKIHQINIDHH